MNSPLEALYASQIVFMNNELRDTVNDLEIVTERYTRVLEALSRRTGYSIEEIDEMVIEELAS